MQHQEGFCYTVFSILILYLKITLIIRIGSIVYFAGNTAAQCKVFTALAYAEFNLFGVYILAGIKFAGYFAVLYTHLNHNRCTGIVFPFEIS